MTQRKTTPKTEDTRKSLYVRYNEMQPTEKKAFINFCVTKLNTSKETAHRWIRGVKIPHTIFQQPIIAGYFQAVPSDVWFETAPVAKRKLQKA